jgi:hypothetical protein
MPPIGINAPFRRFRAFAIGRTVEWTSVADRGDGKLERTRATGSMDTSEFVVGDPEELATGATRTTVRITRPREYANRLLGDGAGTWLVTRFAVYLVKYPNIRVTYDGQVLDPATIVPIRRRSDRDAGPSAERHLRRRGRAGATDVALLHVENRNYPFVVPWRVIAAVVN